MVEVVFLFYYLLAQSYRCVVIWIGLVGQRLLAVQVLL